MRLRLLASSIGLVLTSAGQLCAQTHPEVIRGRVTSDSGAPIRDATVSATRADRSFLQATTDADGRFTIRFDTGTGDYLVHGTALGYKAQRIRVTAKPGDSVLVADMKLAPNVTQLAKVSVTAQKLKVSRGSDPASSVSAEEQRIEGVFATLAPGQEGDLAAVAGMIPGLMNGAAGLSAFGLDPSQNSSTLNGMAFSGTSIPRDAQKSITVATSPFDPARGGFSGAQTNVSLQSGSAYFRRNAHLTLDTPQLQTSDRISRQLGQSTTMLDGSIGSSGPMFGERYFYSSALQLTRTSAASSSLLSADDELLRLAGVAPDSARRLAQVLSNAHVPLSVSGLPDDRLTQRLSFSGRFDKTPYKPGTYDDAPSTWNVLTIANVSTSDANGYSPNSIATRAGMQRNVALTTQGTYSRIGDVVLNETRVAVNVNAANGEPYFRAPGANVLVSSTLPGEDDAVSSLSFGGNGFQDYARRNWTVETVNETQWYTPGSPHRIKVTTEGRFDGYSSAGADNSLGTFAYNSLSAVAAGIPTSFTRTLASPLRRGGELSEYLAVGDYWRKSQTFRVLYGARLEANEYTTSLSANPAIMSAFGESTTQTPDHFHVSPRFAFTWYQKQSGGNGIYFSPLGEQRFNGPQSVIRGGIGDFRSFLSPSLLSDASVSNGLPGNILQLSCYGDAVPTPQWPQYVANAASIPSACAGTTTPVFADAAPSVRLFDRGYDAPHSWRSTLGYATQLWRYSVSLDGTYSLNLDQQGQFDLNFASAQRFTLPNEGGRPVYVNPSSIVASTGAVSSVDARLHPEYGRVLRYQSDLRSSSAQAIVAISPSAWGRVLWNFAYTLQRNSSNTRGFDGTTFYSPALVQGYDARLNHQFQGTIGTTLPYGLSVSFAARLSSGLPYTPVINGDVNGDGLSNDRAFVFDPARSADPVLATGMRTLLASAPGNARDCLMSQLNQAAARNSCQGPWSMYMNGHVGLFSIYGPTRRSISGSLNISNPLAGIDQLVHGSDNLHGWGTAAFADPVLYNVRGFDPQTLRYRYEVNPRFGSAYSSSLAARAPVRITLDIRFDLGVPTAKQQVIRWLSPGRAGDTRPRRTADSLARYMKRQVPNLYTQILALSDSLLLSTQQTEALAKAQVHYNARMDSLWNRAGAYLAAISDQFDDTEVTKYVDGVTEQGWFIDRDEVPTIEGILSPTQVRLAPWVRSLKETVGQKHINMRTYYY